MSARRVALLLSVTLSACAVGPNFKRPAAPTDAGYGAAPTQGETTAAAGVGGNAQRLVEGMDIPADWWTLFGSAPLNQLIEQALKENPDVNAAQAALRQANELYAAQRATLFPSLQGGFSAQRAKNALGTTCQPHEPAAAQSLLQSLHRPAQRELPARCLRRPEPCAGSQQGAGRSHPLSAGGDLSHPQQQCGRHRCPGSLAARADHRHRTTACRCSSS